jgi:hypothetical protein
MSHLFGEDDDFHPGNNHQGHNDDDVEEEEEEDILDMEGTAVNTQLGVLLMRFCPHDSSMLYPQVRVIANLRELLENRCL